MGAREDGRGDDCGLRRRDGGEGSVEAADNLLPLGLVPAGVLEERAEDLAAGLYPGTSAATSERPRTAAVADGSPAP